MYIYTEERTASTRVHWNRKSPTEHTEFAEAAAIKSPRDSIFRPPFFSYPFIFITFCRFTVHLLGTCLWVGCHSWESKKTSEPPPSTGRTLPFFRWDSRTWRLQLDYTAYETDQDGSCLASRWVSGSTFLRVWESPGLARVNPLLLYFYLVEREAHSPEYILKSQLARFATAVPVHISAPGRSLCQHSKQRLLGKEGNNSQRIFHNNNGTSWTEEGTLFSIA